MTKAEANNKKIINSPILDSCFGFFFWQNEYLNNSFDFFHLTTATKNVLTNNNTPKNKKIVHLIHENNHTSCVR